MFRSPSLGDEIEGVVTIYRVVVVTLRDLIREGVKTVLRNSRQFHLLADASTADVLLALSLRPPPDLIIFDAGARPWRTLHDLNKLQQRWPLARPLVLIPHDNELARAILTKFGPPNWVVDGIPASRLLEKLFDLARRLPVGNHDEDLSWVPSAQGRQLATLTPREHQVMEMVAKGLSNKEIASQLTLQVQTVKSYLKVIYSKLGVTNRVQAILAWQNNWLASTEDDLVPRNRPSGN